MKEKYLPESEVIGHQPEKSDSKGVLRQLNKKAKALSGAVALTSILAGQSQVEAGQNPAKLEQTALKKEKAPSVRPIAADIFAGMDIPKALQDALIKVDSTYRDNASKEAQARANFKKAFESYRSASANMDISLDQFRKLGTAIDDASTEISLIESANSLPESAANRVFREFILTVDPNLQSSYENKFYEYKDQVSKARLGAELDSSSIQKEKAAITLQRMRNELKGQGSNQIPRPPKPPRIY